MKIFSLQSKTFFVLSMLVLLTTGCQKDDDLKELDSQKEPSLSNFRVQRIERDKIDANRKLKEKLNEISSGNKSSFKGIVHSSEYGFSINTDYATYMEDVNGTYHSYTFPVIREGEEDLLENLVLSLRPDGSYRILLMAYDITDQEKEQISNNGYVNLEGKTTIYLLEDATLVTDIFGKKLISTNCVSNEYEIGPCAGGIAEEHESVYNSSIGGMCGGSTSTLVNIDIDAACLDGGGGPDPDNNDPGDNTNTNTDTDTSGNHVETGGVGSGDHTAITCTRNCIDQACSPTLDGVLSNLSLSDDEICWLNKSEQSNIKQEIINYLNDGGEMDFAVEAIEALKNGGKVDFEDKIIVKASFIDQYPCHADVVMQSVNVCSDFNIQFLNAFESSQEYYVNYDQNDPITDPGLSGNLAVTRSLLGCTASICNSNITFNNSYFDTITNLGLASAAIHENAHALLYYLWHSQEISVDNANPTYSELSTAYCNALASNDPNNDGTGQTLSILQHQYMVDHISLLGDTLKNYAESIGLTLTDEFCKKLMWSGTLTALPNFTQEYSIEERYDISSMIHAELNNEPYIYI